MAQRGCACTGGVQVLLRYRLCFCCRSNQLGHHAAFQHTHAAAALAQSPDLDDDSLERRFVSKPNSSCSAVKADMWSGLTWADRFTDSVSRASSFTLFDRRSQFLLGSFHIFSIFFFFFVKLQLLKCLGFVRGTFASCCVSLDLDLEASTDVTKCAKFSRWGKSDQIN